MGRLHWFEQLLSLPFRIGMSRPLLAWVALWPLNAFGAELDWLEYRAAPGCPTRDVLEQELLSRSSFRSTPGSEPLLVDIVFEDGSYLGQVRFRAGDALAGRAVRNESCAQVVHAVALIAALMLDTESHDQATPVETPPEPLPREPKRAPPPVTESRAVITSPQNKQPEIPTKVRGIGTLTLGPWFSLTLDGLAAPSAQFGARTGALLTLHGLLSGSQQLVRLSMAQVKSGTITMRGDRSATITWTSIRLDVCHGSGSQRLTSMGLCAWFDVGQWKGEGRVAEASREREIYWPRVGGAGHFRQRIVGGLALHADLGIMVALSRPEFYFAGSDGEPRQTIHKPPRVGPVADLGFELHFW